MVIVRKSDDIAAGFLYQFRRYHYEIGPDCLQSCGEVLFRQTQPFEPMNDIDGKEKYLKESDVGYPAVGGYFAHGVVVKEFPDVFLDGGSWSVEEIDPPGAHRKIGDKDMVDILFVLEEFGLSGFLRVFRNRMSYHHKAVFLFPGPAHLLPEFAYFPASANGLKLAGPRPSFDSGILLGGNYIATFCTVQETNRTAAVVSGVHPEPDAGSGNGFGYLFQTRFDEGDGSGVTGNIARP